MILHETANTQRSHLIWIFSNVFKAYITVKRYLFLNFLTPIHNSMYRVNLCDEAGHYRKFIQTESYTTPPMKIISKEAETSSFACHQAANRLEECVCEHNGTLFSQSEL